MGRGGVVAEVIGWSDPHRVSPGGIARRAGRDGVRCPGADLDVHQAVQSPRAVVIHYPLRPVPDKKVTVHPAAGRRVLTDIELAVHGRDELEQVAVPGHFNEPSLASFTRW